SRAGALVGELFIRRRFQAIQGELQHDARSLPGFVQGTYSAANPTPAALWSNPRPSREDRRDEIPARVPPGVGQNARRTRHSTEPARWPKQFLHPHFVAARWIDWAIAFVAREASRHLADAGNRVPGALFRQNQYSAKVAVADRR